MIKIVGSLSVALLAVAFTTRASADEAGVAAAPMAAQPAKGAGAEPPPMEWYGHQTLIADGVAGAGLTLAMVTAFAGATESAAPVLLFGSLGSFALGAPIVHVANGEVGRGLASLGVRLAAPSLGAWVGLEASRNCNPKKEPFNFCAFGGLVAGFATGMVSASAIDALLLAWKQTPQDPAKASIAPDVSITPNGATIGATGRF